MARRGRSRRPEQRDDFSIANFVAVRSPVIVRPVRVLSDDRRGFHPDRYYRPLFSPVVRDRDVVEYPRHKRASVRASKAWSHFDVGAIGVRNPRSVSLCVRRHRRREVLFAKRKTGKGSRRRQRRRNYWSDVKC